MRQIITVILVIVVSLVNARINETRGKQEDKEVMMAKRLKKAKDVFRVMTFNTWLSGASVRDGVLKIAKHVNLVDPDVVMFQVTFHVYFQTPYISLIV